MLLFKFCIFTTNVYAATDGVLLEPVTNLFANLGDGIMDIMQRTFLGVESSGAWIEKSDNNTWLKIAIIAVGLVLAVVAVVSTICTGGAALTIIASIVGAVIKIGAGTAIAFFAVSMTHFGSNGFYLPEYHLTLEAIFKGDILAFDVNFFEPKEAEYKEKTLENFIKVYAVHDNFYCLNQEGYDQFKQKYGFSDRSEIKTSESTLIGYMFSHSDPRGYASVGLETAYLYKWTYNGKEYSCYYLYDGYEIYDDWNWDNYYWIGDFRENGEPLKEIEKNESIASILQPTIADWYKILRNIALVAMMSVLVYIGIRITLTTVAGDKAKYKQMLVDWVVAICLVLLMHYIMSFAVTINQKIIEAISSITVSGYGGQDEIVGSGSKIADNIKTPSTSRGSDENAPDTVSRMDGAGVQLFIIDDKDAVDRAYKTLVDDRKADSDGKKGKNSSFYNRFYEENGQKVLYWPANGFMEQARLLGQDIGDDETQTKVARAGYNIIYVVLVIYTIIFSFTYLKRVIYMAFLTLIAPLVAITYPIDKISDGKAQAFDMWIKEYIFNLLMQPMHFILYTILVSMAMKFAAKNIFYAVIAIGFLIPAEKILRRFFRFERAQTPGMFAGPAGAALLMQGLNKLMHRPPHKSRLGTGKGEKDDENSKISTYKNGDDPLDHLNSGNDEEDDSIRTTDTSNNEDSGSNPLIGNEENTDTDVGNVNQNNINLPPPTQTANTFNTNRTPSTSTNSSSRRSRNTAQRKKRKVSIGRSIRRGMAGYRDGMVKRYKANKRLKGGVFRRTTRLAAGLAAAGTMAAAGGIIGIATGDATKAAQYMAAGAAGGYKLGKSGVDGVANKLNEQYREPLKQAKIGFYGEEEYQKREHEKFKKREFEQNVANIQKIQEQEALSYKQAKEKAMRIAEYTDNKGINSFNDAYAVDRMINDGFSRAEALAIGNMVSSMDGKGADKMSRKDRVNYAKDLRDKLIAKGMDKDQAREEAIRMVEGTNKFAKYIS